MSFYKASKKSADVQQGGSNYITKSGMFPVMLLAPVVSISKGGSTSIDLYLEYQGQKQIVYGNLRITNNDGTPNKIGNKIFNQLVIIAGLDSVSDPVEVELPIGKKEAMQDVAILEDLCDVEVFLRTQMEYGVHNGSITEKKVIKAFFRASDKATAEEIVNETEAGAGYERELKYVNNITFKDDLTEEIVNQWIKDKRPKGTAGGGRGGGASSGGNTKKAPDFGQRRFGKSTSEE